MRGLFITVEGGDGSGKTTAALRLIEKLKKEGYLVTYTREPGGVAIAEQIRDVIVDVNNKEMDAKTEALLYAASRRQHLVEKVLPTLEKGGIVICDRFIDSSLVYQGIGRGLGVKEVYEMNLFATENVLPDLTVFFDVKPEIALKRVMSDDEREVNRLDLESLDFHQKVYDGYLAICETFKDRIKKIDASLDKDGVYQQLESLVEGQLCKIKNS
ncbi:dTMP kinase [Kandleria vitulina]|uniref:dTMP kinase n=1 Tax=Kandleria vitulina TaxID=1630 RepID=UPI000490B1ED|nr:dTMP kinase [Kandleria vitulina]